MGLIWQDRAVKLLDAKNWAISRISSHDDFDYFPCDNSPERAVAGTLDQEISAIEVDKEDRLVFRCLDGSAWLLEGNPCTTGRLVHLKPGESARG